MLQTCAVPPSAHPVVFQLDVGRHDHIGSKEVNIEPDLQVMKATIRKEMKCDREDIDYGFEAQKIIHLHTQDTLVAWAQTLGMARDSIMQILTQFYCYLPVVFLCHHKEIYQEEVSLRLPYSVTGMDISSSHEANH